MLPPLTDFVALLGISLVLCAGVVHLLAPGMPRRWPGQRNWARWIAVIGLVLLWCPIGPLRLPVVAYVRGISSDLSITLVLLACVGLGQRLFDGPAIVKNERLALSGVVVAAAVFLYPMALGLGDWDSYRLGWGEPAMLAALGVVSFWFLRRGWLVLPAAVALALLAWVAGVFESTNLWDYLLDPWLSVAAIYQCGIAAWQKLALRLKRPAPEPGRPVQG